MSSLSFVERSTNRPEKMVQDLVDAIGFVRAHGRIGEDVQRSALNADGVRLITADRDIVEKLAAPKRVIKVRHLFLLADPRARKRRGGWRKDLLDFLGRIEDKGAIVQDLEMGLTTEKPSHRTGMLAVAFEHLANNGRTTHLAKRRQGRKVLVFPISVEDAVERIWLNRRDYPTEGDAAAAIKTLDKRYTPARARKTYGPRIKAKR